MKAFVTVVAVVPVILAACSGGGDRAPSPTKPFGDPPTSSQTEVSAYSDPMAMLKKLNAHAFLCNSDPTGAIECRPTRDAAGGLQLPCIHRSGGDELALATFSTRKIHDVELKTLRKHSNPALFHVEATRAVLGNTPQTVAEATAILKH